MVAVLESALRRLDTLTVPSNVEGRAQGGVSMSNPALVACLMAVLLSLVGCRKQAPSAAREIEVLCGGSFRRPMERMAEVFEQETGVRATLAFGQSEDLLPHVKMHSRGDLFVTHDPYAQYTEEVGALLRYVTVGHVAPVLVVKKGNPKDIRRVEDLSSPGLRVCLPNPDFSTCGEMVSGLLKRKGIRDAVLENVGNALFRSHAQIGSNIKLGHRDAGIMWNGVAHNWLDAIEIVPTPYEYDEEIRVTVIGLSYSKKRELVEQFLTVAEARGEVIFKEFGYVK